MVIMQFPSGKQSRQLGNGCLVLDCGVASVIVFQETSIRPLTSAAAVHPFCHHLMANRVPFWQRRRQSAKCQPAIQRKGKYALLSHQAQRCCTLPSPRQAQCHVAVHAAGVGKAVSPEGRNLQRITRAACARTVFSTFARQW